MRRIDDRLLNLIAFGDHALNISVVVLLLNTPLLVRRGAGPDSRTRDSATRRTDRRAAAPANGSAKTRAEGGASYTFQKACRVGTLSLAANLLVRVLLAAGLFRLKDLEGLALCRKSADRGTHWRAGAGRKQKGSAA
jgi:hypothetical protein